MQGNSLKKNSKTDLFQKCVERARLFLHSHQSQATWKDESDIFPLNICQKWEILISWENLHANEQKAATV